MPHEGKQDLEKSIPRKLRAWTEPGARFCVIRDNDGADCRALKESLVELCRAGRRDDTLVRIACEELEAWYFGAPDALAKALSRDALRRIADRPRFRDPDAIAQPASVLAQLAPGFQKVSGARLMAQTLTRENRSRSFGVLLAGLDRLARELRAASGDR